MGIAPTLRALEPAVIRCRAAAHRGRGTPAVHFDGVGQSSRARLTNYHTVYLVKSGEFTVPEGMPMVMAGLIFEATRYGLLI